MANFCLTRQAKENFKNALRNRIIDPDKMAVMDPVPRRDLIAKYVGKENAVQVNALFESKLLLKNQKRGYITWAKQVGGITPEVRRDLIVKIERLNEALSEKKQEIFLEDLVQTRLGLSITEEQFETLTDLTTQISDLKKNFDGKTLEWKDKESKAKYGATQVVLENYVSDIKGEKQALLKMLKDRGYQFKTELKDNAPRAIGKLLLDTASEIANNSISLVASVDDSFVGRQGIFTLLSGHPITWSKTALLSLSDFARTLGGYKAEDALKAQIYSDPLYINGEYKKAGIIDMKEEQFPTSLPERIPVVGRLFKASETAFKNSSLRMRTELYKTLRNTLTSRGIEMDDRQIKGLGEVVNSLGARGQLGRHGDNPILRLLMWAPKMLKADIDILTGHQFFSDIPKESRNIAIGNLIKIVIATAIIEAVATYQSDESTEFDPRSSDFLKIKEGDTRFNVLRNIPALITLVARLATGQYKSSTTGEIKQYEAGFGKKSRFDALIEFFLNKTPPATGAAVDILKGEDSEGKEPTLTSILFQRGVPISIQNAINLYDNPTLDKTMGVVADFFGIGSNTFRDSNIKTQIIPEGQKIDQSDFIKMVSIYAEALGTDPETAFNRIFTGQKIRRVTNGTVIVERMSLSESQSVKKKSNADNPQVKLDHTIPLQLGGGNEASNLKLVTTSRWSEFTPVENVLGTALKNKRISKEEAQRVITKFKGIEDKSERDAYKQQIYNKYKVDEILQRLESF